MQRRLYLRLTNCPKNMKEILMQSTLNTRIWVQKRFYLLLISALNAWLVKDFDSIPGSHWSRARCEDISKQCKIIVGGGTS